MKGAVLATWRWSPIGGETWCKRPKACLDFGNHLFKDGFGTLLKNLFLGYLDHRKRQK